MQQPKQRDIVLAMAAFFMAFMLWQVNPLSPAVYPLRFFVTFIHELGHGLAAVLTGGEFVRFEVFSNGGGVAYSRGGMREAIILAGYNGAALFGAALLWLTNRMRRAEYLAVGLGISFSLLTVLYAGLDIDFLSFIERILVGGLMLGGIGYFLVAEENSGRWRAVGVFLAGVFALLYLGTEDNSLTMIFGVLFGVGLVVLGYLGWRGYEEVLRFTLNLLAFTVALNAITDATFLLQIVSREDLLVRNDALSMELETGVPAEMWAFSWIMFSCLTLGGTVWALFIRPQRQAAIAERSTPEIHITSSHA